MDLFCPHCTRRVTVPDGMAGQVTACPLCAKQFKAPTLTAPPAPKPPAPPLPPPPSPMSTFSVSPPQPAPPPVLSAPPEPVQSTIVYPPKADADASESKYTRSLQLTLTTSWLAFVPTLCVGLIFVLSFFPWHHVTVSAKDIAAATAAKKDAPANGANLWALAYPDPVLRPTYLAFVLLLVLLMLAAPAVAVVDRSQGSAPAKFDTIVKWAYLAVALLFTVGYLLLLVSWFLVHFVAKGESLAIGLEAALRLQFVAMLASLGLFWVSKRKPANLPPPRLKVRW